MKRWLTLTLAGLLALSLNGCGSSDGAGFSAPKGINSTSSELSSSSGSSSGQSTEDPWGLTLSVKGVTSTGLTLVITQEGGSPTGTLQYGSDYTLEEQRDGTWQAVQDIAEGDVAWTSEAYLVTMDGQTEQLVDWNWLYGSLSPGHYRLSKDFMDFRDTGDYDTQTYQVEFDIP